VSAMLGVMDMRELTDLGVMEMLALLGVIEGYPDPVNLDRDDRRDPETFGLGVGA